MSEESQVQDVGTEEIDEDISGDVEVKAVMEYPLPASDEALKVLLKVAVPREAGKDREKVREWVVDATSKVMSVLVKGVVKDTLYSTKINTKWKETLKLNLD